MSDDTKKIRVTVNAPVTVEVETTHNGEYAEVERIARVVSVRPSRDDIYQDEDARQTLDGAWEAGDGHTD